MLGLLYLWPAALLWALWFYLGCDLFLVLAGAATGVGIMLTVVSRG